MKPLSAEEKKVIVDKGTELPFAGKYTDHFETGTYHCRQCGEPLYRAQDKFHSGCGWPAFDDEIRGAVKKLTDADGRRVEITCAKCGGHLGHVFAGEGFTQKNLRHCVNSISLHFVAAQSAEGSSSRQSTQNDASPETELSQKSKEERAIFAGGCFWGVEYFFQNLKGVISTMPGYTGGRTVDPSYREVCTGMTGHLEAVEIIYDSNLVSYEDLVRLFFEIHDPAQRNGQGPDIGEQYLSAIFYFDEEQRQIAERLVAKLREKGINAATRIEPAAEFYPAEEYHRRYYDKTGKVPYCHRRVKRFE